MSCRNSPGRDDTLVPAYASLNPSSNDRTQATPTALRPNPIYWQGEGVDRLIGIQQGALQNTAQLRERVTFLEFHSLAPRPTSEDGDTTSVTLRGILYLLRRFQPACRQGDDARDRPLALLIIRYHPAAQPERPGGGVERVGPAFAPAAKCIRAHR